jgi:cell wall-associated NlpC family hydrolase/LysM repeat protein
MANRLQLRWALLCVAATQGALLATCAEASQTITVGRGDSIDSLARRFHVSVRDIARANGLKPDAVLRDGVRLTIPDPPKAVVNAPTTRVAAVVRGDRIAVRLGPGAEYRRIAMLDDGARVVGTHRLGDWTQVELAGGKTGWMKSDFLSMSAAAGSVATPARAAGPAPAAASKPRPGSAPTARVATLQGDNVQLRSEPSRSAPSRGLLDRGATGRVLAADKGWVQLRFGSGRVGWVKSEFVRQSVEPVRTASAGASAVRSATRVVTVKGDRVSLRAAAATSAKRLALIDRGRRLTVVSLAPQWAQVAVDGKTRGWVRRDLLTSLSGASAATSNRLACVKGDRVSVRSQPDATSRRVTMVDDGERLHIIGTQDGWVQIRLPEGKKGWVRSDFVGYSAARVARVERSHYRLALNRRSHRRSSWARRSNRPEADAPEPSNDVIRTAYNYRGTPYRYGAAGRGGFDCSGFTSYIFRKQGVALPHSAAGQFSEGKRVSSGELKPGDLVFFHTTRRGISHVGVYVGKNKFIHASSAGGRVRVDSLNDGYYQSRFRGARRVR